MGQRRLAAFLLEGKILESLATYVVDRAMMHADRGNSGKGAREKKDLPLGDST